MSASPASRIEVVVLATLVAALGLRLVLAPPAPEPALVLASACQPWMADALPGVGAKRREATAAAIRTGDLDAVPKQARAAAQGCFSFEGESSRTKQGEGEKEREGK